MEIPTLVAAARMAVNVGATAAIKKKQIYPHATTTLTTLTTYLITLKIVTTELAVARKAISVSCP